MSAGSGARLLRSFLYAPGSSARILDKALVAGADAVICDLEDAVPAAEKAAARERVGALVAERAGGALPEVHVRINRRSGGYDHADLDAVVHRGLAALRLPKAETPEAVAEVAGALDALEAARGIEAGTLGLYPTVESAAGLHRVEALAAASARIVAVAFGSADFLADIGAPAGAERDATLLARSRIVLASRLADLRPPVDGAYVDLDDVDGLRAHTAWVKSLGFYGKSVLHPRQLEAVHDVFTPTAEEVARARRVLAALAEGTAVVEGGFVDEAVARRARALVALAEALGR